MTAINTAQVTRLEGDYCTAYLDEGIDALEDITLIAFAAQLSDNVTLSDLIRFHHGLAEIIEALKKIYRERNDEDYPEADHARCIACERPYAPSGEPGEKLTLKGLMDMAASGEASGYEEMKK